MRTVHSVISSRNVDVRAGRRFTAAAALPGLAAIGAYLAVALARLTYPFTIERHQLVHQEHWRTLAACQFADPDLFFPISS